MDPQTAFRSVDIFEFCKNAISNRQRTMSSTTKTSKEKESQGRDYRKVNVIHCVVIVGVVMPLYALTAYRGVAGGDSGELVAQSCRLGVAHPPGYPLFTMMNYVSTQLLAFLGGSPACRSNLLSCAFDVGAAVALYSAVELWTRNSAYHNPSAALGAAILFATSPLIWLYAISSEVFALNNFFAGLLLYFSVRFLRDGRRRDLLWGAFICGLAMTNQHTIVLFEIPLILSMIWRLWTSNDLTTGILLDAAARFCLGLVPYVYLPVSAYLSEDGGGWGDLRSLSGFVHHIRRADYGTFRLFSGNRKGEIVADLPERLWAYASNIFTHQTLGTGILPLLMVVGACLAMGMSRDTSLTGSRRRRRHQRREREGTPNVVIIGRVLIGAYAFYMLVFHSLSNIPLNEGLLFGVHARFWQQPNMIAFMCLACGAGYVANLMPRVLFNARATCAILMTVAVAAQISRHFHALDMSETDHLMGYGRALLDPLPRGALLLATYDLQWTVVRYLQECEGHRTDVVVLSQPMMSYPWYVNHQAPYEGEGVIFPGTHLVSSTAMDVDGFTLSSFIESNLNRPSGVFVGGSVPNADLRYKSDTYDRVPHGIVYRSMPHDTSLYKRLTSNPTRFYDDLVRSWQLVRDAIPSLPDPQKFHDETWEWMAMRDYWSKLGKASNFLAFMATTSKSSDALTLARAARCGEEVLANERLEDLAKFNLATTILKNTGVCYMRLVKEKMTLPSDFSLFAPLSDISVAHKSQHAHWDAHLEVMFTNGVHWSSKASVRLLELWSRLLTLPGFKKHPEYSTVANTVRALGGLPSSTKK